MHRFDSMAGVPKQEIRFCKTLDGVTIAYSTMGQGYPLVIPPQLVTHLEADLIEGPLAEVYEGLSHYFTVVRFDKRGTGLSERDVSDYSSDETFVPDIEAVVDTLSLPKFAMYGFSAGGRAKRKTTTMKNPIRKFFATTMATIAFGFCGISSSNAATDDGAMVFETLRVRKEGAVLFAEIAAPPMNLLGPELVRDLVSLIKQAEANDAIHVLVFKSADPDYFIAHVDVNRIKEYRAEAAKLVGEPSIALLFHHLSRSRLVTIAQIEGRVRGAGSEFVLACDMRFAARESTIFGQPEPGLGVIPGGGAVQHLTRLMGRARALEVMLSADDYDAALAERYGWINRALPAKDLDGFVRSLAHRIAGFPAAGLVAVKERVNAIALAPVEDFRRDSDLFGEGVRHPDAQKRTEAALKRGFQTREAEMSLGRLLGNLVETDR